MFANQVEYCIPLWCCIPYKWGCIPYERVFACLRTDACCCSRLRPVLSATAGCERWGAGRRHPRAARGGRAGRGGREEGLPAGGATEDAAALHHSLVKPVPPRAVWRVSAARRTGGWRGMNAVWTRCEQVGGAVWMLCEQVGGGVNAGWTLCEKVGGGVNAGWTSGWRCEPGVELQHFFY